MVTADARGTVAVINLGAIAANVKLFLGRLMPGTELMAVVKADAYGHGAVPVAKTALSAGAGWLGVATAEEGLALRSEGIDAPILILGASNPEQVRLAVQHHLDLTVFEPLAWENVLYWASALNETARVHLKVDTGMGRLGVRPDSVVTEWSQKLSDPRVVFQGLMSHLAASDMDLEYTAQQLEIFLDVIEQMRQRNSSVPPTIHLANSAATLRFPGTHFNLVRVGIGLYGACPYPKSPRLASVMEITAPVTMVKRVPPHTFIGYGKTYQTTAWSTVATLGIGYADGYRRAFSNRAWALLHGRRCLVVGRISMDQTTLVVPDDMPVAVGDSVVLLGSDGEDQITADDWGQWADTISYEVLTGISGRIPRRYIENVEKD